LQLVFFNKDRPNFGQTFGGIQMPLDLNTNLLKQFMLSGGAAMSGMPWLQAIAPIGINTLQAQNQYGATMGSGGGSSGQGFDMQAMMKYILGGGMPGSTMKSSDKGVQFTIPQTQFSKGNQNDLQPFAQGASLGVPTPNVPTPSANMNLPPFGLPDLMKMLQNPSVSQQGNQMPNLAGLTPQDVNNIITGKLNIEQMNQAKAMQSIDMIYKGALTREAIARANEMNVPKDTRTAAIQNYEYALESGYRGTFDEFVNQKGNEATSIEEWKQAKADGYEGTYYDWKKEMTALGGGLSLDEKVQQKIGLGQAEGQVFFDSGAWIKDIQDYSGSKQARVDEVMSGKPKSQLVYERIVESIAGRGGELVDAPEWSKDGKFLIFKVKWSSGDIREYKHAVVE